MNEIQDIILESEYNVLLALSEYYDKQLILESYYMEEDDAISTDTTKQNIFQRFINWCRKMIANLKAKFHKISDSTPVPNDINTQAESLVNAAKDFADTVNDKSLNETQVSQKMNTINTNINNAKNQQSDSTSKNPITVGLINKAIKDVSTATEQISFDVNNMKSVSMANKQAEKEKLKTSGNILNGLNSVSNTVTSGTKSSEPITDVNSYSQSAINKIKNAASAKDAQNAHYDAQTELRSAKEWYQNQLSSNKASESEAEHYKQQIANIRNGIQMINQAKKDRISQLT